MNWRHRPPRSTPTVFRFLFAMSIFIFRFLFVRASCAGSWLLPPVPGGNLSPHTTYERSSDCLVLLSGLSSYSRRTVVHFARKAKLVLPATLLSVLAPRVIHGQAKPSQPTRKETVGPPAPQSTHYPILLLAFGNNPDWSLRIGQKGPERLDRPGYPHIPLEPSDVTHEGAADSWTYHAKDSATGAAIAVHLMRETCADAKNDTLTPTPPPSGRYSFRASVDHAQIGSLRGCARIAAELFPKINNQPDDEEDTEKKKPPAPTI